MWVFLGPNLMHGVDRWNKQVLSCSYNICFENKRQKIYFLVNYQIKVNKGL